MKKIVSIALVFVIVYSIVGFYLTFEIERFTIREEIKEKLISALPENELTVLIIPSSANKKIHWENYGKEFSYKGLMYDVVKIKKSPGSTSYYCFCDLKESNLMCHLEKLVKDQCDHSKSKQNLKKLSLTYFIACLPSSCCLNEAKACYYPFTPLYCFTFSKVLSPPPRFLAIA